MTAGIFCPIPDFVLYFWHGLQLFAGVKEYMNNFRFINAKNGLCFEDIPEEIYTLELPKVPLTNERTAGWDWLQFLRARDGKKKHRKAV